MTMTDTTAPATPPAAPRGPTKARRIILAATAALALVGVGGFAGTSLAQRGYGFGVGLGGFGPMRGLGAELLREVDADRDGRITQAEIDGAVNLRFERFDADKNGRLSLDEFAALWADLTRPVTVRAFQFMDADGDAAVTRAEVDERFSRLVARFDRNGDGALSMADRGRGGRQDGRGDRGPRERD